MQGVGQTITVNVAPTDPISTIQEQILEKKCLPKDKQFLTFCGKPLSPDNLVSAFSISRGGTLQLKVRATGRAADVERSYLILHGSTMHTVQLGSTITYAGLKEVLMPLTGIPADSQRIVYNFREWDNADALGEIPSHKVITVSRRLT